VIFFFSFEFLEPGNIQIFSKWLLHRKSTGDIIGWMHGGGREGGGKEEEGKSGRGEGEGEGRKRERERVARGERECEREYEENRRERMGERIWERDYARGHPWTHIWGLCRYRILYYKVHMCQGNTVVRIATVDGKIKPKGQRWDENDRKKEKDN
jgi:hypothetical protein